MSATLKVTVRCDWCGQVISEDAMPLESVKSLTMSLSPVYVECQGCADRADALSSAVAVAHLASADGARAAALVGKIERGVDLADLSPAMGANYE